ncbi:MAG: hypothetical protein HMLKMBBP_01479 [Planctomycetes bacterium]|nr:hypothetical protein [Planctomycetota bacterium]
MMDRLTTVLGVGGIGCFAVAFLLSGAYPYAITDGREPEAGWDEIAKDVSPDFKDMAVRFPGGFAGLEGGPDAAKAGAPEDAWRAAYAKAIRRGRDIYIAEACWHCHSQYVRPVANEDIRFGKVRSSRDDNNVAQRPVLWGTRRVGPDLTHEGGLRSNDWHAAHLLDPQSTSPGSVMPRYEWYFADGWQVARRVDPAVAARERLDPATARAVSGVYASEDEAKAEMARIAASLPDERSSEKTRMSVVRAKGPTPDGVAVLAYLQWLGTWEAPPKEGGAE